MTLETTFFQDQGATVTNSRFMTNGQTHALSGITSVSEFVQNPNRVGPIIFGVFGLISLSANQYLFGLLLIVIAIVIWMSQKPMYSVVIRTAAGESKALTDADSKRVSSVISALNDAIVHRG